MKDVIILPREAFGDATERGKRTCAKCGRGQCKLYRPYGEFLREGRIVCKADIPQGQEGWYVPLCEDVDGTVWGYTSARQDSIDYFDSLPD